MSFCIPSLPPKPFECGSSPFSLLTGFEFADFTSQAHYKEKRLRSGAVSNTASRAAYTRAEHGSDDAITVFRDSMAKSAAGLKTHGGVKYKTDVQRLTGLMPPGSKGINHSECA